MKLTNGQAKKSYCLMILQYRMPAKSLAVSEYALHAIKRKRNHKRNHKRNKRPLFSKTQRKALA